MLRFGSIALGAVALVSAVNLAQEFSPLGADFRAERTAVMAQIDAELASGELSVCTSPGSRIMIYQEPTSQFDVSGVIGGDSPPYAANLADWIRDRALEQPERAVQRERVTDRCPAGGVERIVSERTFG
ncbi:MAG: hypothetical protein GC136_07875 [Alphaproteobacteria bacterium]|nr:hypothetical protein [Alphaproteobacteria bacterium]